MAAMIVKRDAFNLASSLERLVGAGTAQYVFGLGVLGMAVSTIIILMLINGFVICEMLGLPSTGPVHRVGCYLAGVSGPFIWSKAGFWLAVPTSMFGMCLLPIAYFAFLFMMNSKSLLGNAMPTGGKRLWWNILMLIATGMATFSPIGASERALIPSTATPRWASSLPSPLSCRLDDEGRKLTSN
ncbi:MAG: divalent metal cation transporter [Planctomycetaceae bacterium]